MTAVFTDWQGRAGVTPLQVTDSSLTGLGALCGVELTPGMSLSLCAADIPAPTRTGVVVRCRREENGWRIGLSFTRRCAA